MTRPFHILLSVDTEEDQWQPQGREVTVENAAELAAFHTRVEAMGLCVTYFATHSMAVDGRSAAALRELAERGAEIGAHVHPWSTPPHEESFGGRNTMLLNLPGELQRRKIEATRRALADAVGSEPVSFRAGRFGFGRDTARALVETGFETDSSVTPFYDWSRYDDGPDYHGAPLDAYRIDPAGDPLRHTPSGALREVPVSVGFTRRPFELLARTHRTLFRRRSTTPLIGALSHLGLLRHVVGSPEGEEAHDLVALARCLYARGHAFVHLFLHSSSLMPGLTPFTPDVASRDRLLARLEEFADAVRSFAAVESATVGDYARSKLG